MDWTEAIEMTSEDKGRAVNRRGGALARWKVGV